MRIKIYTNRLPYPPIGGIPRFVHGLSQSLSLFDIESEFILPNLENSNLEIESSNGQNSIEDALARNPCFIPDKAPINFPQDVTLTLQDCIKSEIYSSKKFHSLYLRKDKTLDIINRFDALIISGSALLICNEQNFIESISSIDIPRYPQIIFYSLSSSRNRVLFRFENQKICCSLYRKMVEIL